MKRSWEADTSIENMEAVNSRLINLDDTSEGDCDSDEWPVHLK
jgi:hypothetical protein